MLTRSTRALHRVSFSFCARYSRTQGRASATATATAGKQRIVFLGTPEVATIPLQGLLEATSKPDADFEVVAVVSQPPRSSGRGRKTPKPSPVHQLAIDHGFDESAILTPVKANEGDFLETLERLKPDLCVTAAYGNMLPQRFLDCPKHGTLNIHPSLLPRYRGAAPVNRALENGDAVTGVSVAFTVRACDAGPVLAQRELPLQGDEQAPELLRTLFTIGTELLVEKLPDVWSGNAERDAVPQDEAAVTHAAKMSKDDAWLDFGRTASALHNQVRGFAGWPGTCAKFRISMEGKDDVVQDIKILRTRVATAEEAAEVAAGDSGEVFMTKMGAMLPCSDGTVLVATDVQVPGKKACSAADLVNGFVGKRVFLAARA